MKIFFIGICGISMSALACLLKEEGHEIKGSDLNCKNKPKCLGDIKVFSQQYLEGVKWADLIVCSSAVKENEETNFAKQLGKKIIPRGELLGKISSSYEKVIAVAGSHGKTTTTAMIFHTLFVAGKNPTLHLGGNLKNIGNYYNGGKELFVTEACEYYDNFLFLNPYISVITNVEQEHLDYFKNFHNEKKSFQKFKNQSCISIDKTFNKAKNIMINKEGKLSFSWYKKDQFIARVKMKIGEKVNAKNAMFCVEVCEQLGLTNSQIKLGLETFAGVEKRCEKKENAFAFTTYVDYAHHPKEIEESGKYFKSICKGRCVAIFQPHTFSRTKNFYSDFIKTLSIFDEIICFKTFPAREKSTDGLNETDLALGLAKIGKKALVCKTEKSLKKIIKNYKKEDIIVFLGAGDLPDKFNFFCDLT